MLVDDVMNCSFPSWYPAFEKITIPSLILSIPQPVLDYLQEDGELVLPAECNVENRDGVEDDYEDFGDTNWEDHPSSSELQQKSFPEFSSECTETLR